MSTAPATTSRNLFSQNMVAVVCTGPPSCERQSFKLGGALDFDDLEVQTIETLMPWLWAVQACNFSEAGEAEMLATTADVQQGRMTEGFPSSHLTSLWRTLSPRDQTENRINAISLSGWHATHHV